VSAGGGACLWEAARHLHRRGFASNAAGKGGPGDLPCLPLELAHASHRTLSHFCTLIFDLINISCGVQVTETRLSEVMCVTPRTCTSTIKAVDAMLVRPLFLGCLSHSWLPFCEHNIQTWHMLMLNFAVRV